MTDRSLPLEGQMLAHVDFDAEPPAGGYTRPSQTADLEKANLITSKVAGQDVPWEDDALHKVVLDIDLPAKLVPSSTPGHGHLFIDKAIRWDDYVKLLEALAACGLVEPGYVFASKERGYSCVRLPWVKKREPVPTTSGTADESLF